MVKCLAPRLQPPQRGSFANGSNSGQGYGEGRHRQSLYCAGGVQMETQMQTIYHVEGKLCRDFVGQISYTVCLEQAYEELDLPSAQGIFSPGKSPKSWSRSSLPIVKRNMASALPPKKSWRMRCIIR